MNSSYSILTSITLHHDFYSDGRCEDFTIEPTSETLARMSSAGIKSKMIGNSLLLLSRVDEDGRVEIQPPADLVLRFYLQLQNTNFQNFTNTGSAKLGLKYFTNLSATKVGDSLYLNKRVPDYSPTPAYEIGEMISFDGLVYEAIQTMDAGSHNPSDSEYWLKRDGLQYVHQEDDVLTSDGMFHVAVEKSAHFTISIFKLNPETLLYDGLTTAAQTIHFKEETAQLDIPMHHLQTGRYKVVVNGQSFYVYHDPTASTNRCYAVLEMFNSFKPVEEFGWLETDGKPKELVHQLHFANRWTIWRYIVRNEGATKLEMNGTPNAFIRIEDTRQFVSSQPLPLKQQPIKSLQLLNGLTIISSKLPNPQTERISTYMDPLGNNFLCSEVYLNL